VSDSDSVSEREMWRQCEEIERSLGANSHPRRTIESELDWPGRLGEASFFGGIFDESSLPHELMGEASWREDSRSITDASTTRNRFIVRK
jgi:hypothetical protein